MKFLRIVFGCPEWARKWHILFFLLCFCIAKMPCREICKAFCRVAQRISRRFALETVISFLGIVSFSTPSVYSAVIASALTALMSKLR